MNRLTRLQPYRPDERRRLIETARYDAFVRSGASCSMTVWSLLAVLIGLAITVVPPLLLDTPWWGNLLFQVPGIWVAGRLIRLRYLALIERHLNRVLQHPERYPHLQLRPRDD